MTVSSNYDCSVNNYYNPSPTSDAFQFSLPGSLSVNVSVTSSKDFINAGQLSVSSSSRDIMLFELLPLTVMVFLMHILLLEFQFL